MPKDLKSDLEPLKPHATERQREYINAIITHKGYRHAAAKLGVSQGTISESIQRLRKKAGIEGHLPELGIEKSFPGTGHVAKGYSRWFKTEDGGFWIKTDVPLSHRLEIAEAAIKAFQDEIKPLPPIKRDTKFNKQIDEFANLYVLSDVHIGALSWHEETGADWDIDIAEETIIDAFRYQIANSPNAEHAIFCQLGDALHYDGMRAETPAHRHHVDADSRPQKMVRATIRIFRKVIETLARRHNRVTVLHAMGNHDPYGSIHLQEWSRVLYENNPQVDVVCNPSPYYAMRHGAAFLGFHHGHRRKMAQLVDVFSSAKYWDMKNGCRTAYIHSGHEHHRELKEFSGGICEMHPTLAARSSYESHGGYSADRSMVCVTYHSKGKEHCRSTFYPECER